MESKDLMKNENGAELAIVVDDGRVRVPIRNEHGDEVGMFYFNPTDLGIVDRFRTASDKFGNVVAPLENLSDDATEDEQFEALGEAKERLYRVCDELFGGNMSEAFFGNINPFSPTDGVFYCEKVLNAVSDFVSQQFGKETSKINSRVQKYTKDYQKKSGKHKDGRK